MHARRPLGEPLYVRRKNVWPPDDDDTAGEGRNGAKKIKMKNKKINLNTVKRFTAFRFPSFLYETRSSDRFFFILLFYDVATASAVLAPGARARSPQTVLHMLTKMENSIIICGYDRTAIRFRLFLLCNTRIRYCFMRSVRTPCSTQYAVRITQNNFSDKAGPNRSIMGPDRPEFRIEPSRLEFHGETARLRGERNRHGCLLIVFGK